MNTRHISAVPHFLLALAAALLLIATTPAAAQPPPSQTPDDVAAAITRVDKGDADNVRALLPDLIAKYQNTPGLLYLEGRLSTDGIEGVKFYQSVVDNFPKSEWADDALFRIYQYYYAIGLYKTADLKLQELRKDYPTSPHVTGHVAESVPQAEEPAITIAKKDTVAIDTAQAAVAPPARQQDSSPAPRPVPVQAPPQASGGYSLQVGAFSTVANAEKQKAFFEDRGFTAEITNKVRSGRSLHLVWVGNFRTADEAMKLGKDIKTKYKITGIVVERY